MGVQDNKSMRNNQNNQGNTSDLLTSAGDILINNRNGTTTRLPRGQEDQVLLISNKQPVWADSIGQTMRVGYWSYPESSAWNATYGENGVPFNENNMSRYDHAYKIYAEFKTLNSSGAIVDKSTSAQGGNTAGNITIYKNNCQELWCTVSSASFTDISLLTDNLGTTGAQAITDITNFVSTNTLSGVDINFEDFGSWTAGAFITNFNTWLSSLKTSLNNVDASLNIDLPYIGNATIAAAYNFDYSTFVDNVDTITIMCYDAGFDFGYGLGHCPIELLVGGDSNDKGQCDDAADEQGTTSFYENGVLGKYASDNSNNNMDKLVVGLPSYGFAHLDSAGVWTFQNNLTRNKINFNATYATSVLNGNRDNSGDLRWFTGTHTVVLSDGESMRRRAEMCRRWMKKWELDNPLKSKPLYECIFWHMGGNNYSFYE